MKLINHLKDTEYEFKGIKEVREIARSVMINEKNEVALLKIKGEDEDFGKRDYYELPGGGVERGETLEETVKREMQEETGYEVEVIAPIGKVIDYYNAIYRENHNHYFLTKAKRYVGTNYTDLEKRLVATLVFVKIDKAIELYENEMYYKIGKLVQNRELPILKLAKIMMEEIYGSKNI